MSIDTCINCAEITKGGVISIDIWINCAEITKDDVMSIDTCINCAIITKDGVISIDISINCAEITKDGVISIDICINCAEITKDGVISIDICINCAEITKDGVSTRYIFRSWCPIQSWSVALLQLLSRLSCTKGWVEVNQWWNILLTSVLKCKMKLMVLPVVREARCEGLAQWVLHVAASC